jgi:hypothetical protein
MMNPFRLPIRSLGLVATALSMLAPGLNAKAAPVELISNGDFESGSLSSWTVYDQAGGSGSFFLDDASGSTPLSGEATVGPASGNFYGVSDQTGPGAHALIQKFTLPSTGISQAILSWEMFVNDWSRQGPIVNPAGLDYTADPNQHGRVDLITAQAADIDPLNTGTGVLANFYLSVDPHQTLPNSYIKYSVNILPHVTSGGTYALRFAEVDNQSFLNLGVDNVSVQISGNTENVPGPLPVLGATCALGFSRRLKKRIGESRRLSLR